MTVTELIEILKELPGETEVFLTLVSAPEEGDDESVTDVYDISGVIPWEADDGDEGDGPAVWLVAGEDDDVDRLFAELDAAEED
jgi:hypothetical protein